MAEKKVKEPTLRDRIVDLVGVALLNEFEVGEIPVTKEGFLLGAEGKHFVVKVIQKKNLVEQNEIKGLFVAPDESENDFVISDVEEEEEDFEDEDEDFDEV